MWERQYEHGRWNGHKLNILSTAIDGGKRLHVSEIPYAELPHVKVMGSKSRSISIEVVFVSADSLANANAFIQNLETSPSGELEHPWLGELSLVFETFSQSISTKRGLVSLSLTFVRNGVTPTITISTSVRAKEQSSIVEGLSSERFVHDVQSMDVSQINQTQEDFTQALTVLVDISNRLNLTDDALKTINHAINEAFSSISSLVNEPLYFAKSVSAAMDSVADGLQAEPTSESEAVDNARNAQALLLSKIQNNSTTEHHNIQLVTGAVKMSKDLVELEKTDSFGVSIGRKQSTIIQSDIINLIAGIDECITDTTKASTLDRLALYDSLVRLKDSVQQQHAKVIAGSEPHRTVSLPVFRPALVLAHDQYTNERLLTAINSLQHPLFMRGNIAVRDDE